MVEPLDINIDIDAAIQKKEEDGLNEDQQEIRQLGIRLMWLYHLLQEHEHRLDRLEGSEAAPVKERPIPN